MNDLQIQNGQFLELKIIQLNRLKQLITKYMSDEQDKKIRFYIADELLLEKSQQLPQLIFQKNIIMPNQNQIIQKSNNHYIFYSLSCGLASFAATFVTNILHPFQLVKIRFQSHDGKSNLQNLVPKYNGVFNALKQIYKTQGLKGLYKGFLISFLSQSLAQSLFFIIYQKRLIHYENQINKPRMKAVAYASIQASIIGTVLTQPLWVIKTRMILNVNKNISELQNFIKSIKQIQNQYGLKGYVRGLLLSVLLCFNGFIQMLTYQGCKSIYQYWISDQEQTFQYTRESIWRKEFYLWRNGQNRQYFRNLSLNNSKDKNSTRSVQYK